jgi:small-conductance mechanosensitive channel/CRP-like cAMP-binding protein
MQNPNNRKPFVQMLRATAAPVLGLCLLALLDYWIRSSVGRMMYWDRAASLACILLSISLAHQLICSVALDFLLAKATGRQVPKILKHLIGIAAVVAAILLSANVLYSGVYTSLLALSSVIAVVIGLALRPIILDIFSGLSANLDAAFHIGDWIEISGRNGGVSYTGWVEEINWRTTHLKTRSGNLIICPNSTLSISVITNFSSPSRLSRYDIRVELPPEIDLERARRILLAAVQATLDVENGPSSEKAPDVLITELKASGVEYWIRFWLDPSSQSQDFAQDLVSRSVLRHLQFAGIPLAEKVILHRDKRALLDMATPASRAEVLGRAALFNGVQTSVLERLAERISLHSFTMGDNLIVQGTQDNEMYLLVEGAVDVIVTVEDKDVIITRLQVGQYFGEMSLLTGEPRTATIRAATDGAAYRIDRDAVAPVLESDPPLMDLISRNLAERNLSRQAKAAASQDETPGEKCEGFASVLLGKMMGIFRSGR